MIRSVNMTAIFAATVFTVAMTAADSNPQVQINDPTTGGVSID